MIVNGGERPLRYPGQRSIRLQFGNPEILQDPGCDRIFFLYGSIACCVDRKGVVPGRQSKETETCADAEVVTRNQVIVIKEILTIDIVHCAGFEFPVKVDAFEGNRFNVDLAVR